MLKKDYDIIIIGSGPAGLTAAIYAVRSNHTTLVISGITPGGQLMLTTDVEDFPGFPGGIQGPDLMKKIRKQAELLDVDFFDEDVNFTDFNRHPFLIGALEKKFSAKAVVIATGASAKWMGLESEKRLIGRGVSACATCDGMFFKGKDVVVIGGGDTAMREALFLSKICKTVTVIHRRDKLRAQAALQQKAESTKNIKWMFNSIVEEFIGKDKLDSIKIKNVKDKKIINFKCQGAFVAIGHKPNTDFLNNKIKLDSHNYIFVDKHAATNVNGVFAAGDVHDYKYMQAVTAAGAGCMAAMDAVEFLEDLKHNNSKN